ncbi:hypothetical protein HZB02_00640 [Candidatus Woesearchaeota archaeon]|nr:hypothetical protein [Candidatus Woesearchaeota archaeon]
MNDMQIDYAPLTPRRSALGIVNPTNVALLDPALFFLADVMVTPVKQLKRDLRTWRVFWDQHADREDMLFPHDEPTLVPVRKDDDGGYVKERRKILELSDRELVTALEQRIHREEGAYNLWRNGGREVFALDENGETTCLYAGNIVLTGKVKGKTSGRGKASFRDVHIKGPFVRSRYHLSEVTVNSQDYEKTGLKQGYHRMDMVDVHAAALLLFSHYYPEKIRNYDELLKQRNDLAVWLPFHSREPQQHQHIVTPYPIHHPETLTALKLDVLIERYVYGAKFFGIAERLFQLPHIYDGILLDLFVDGKAKHGIIPNAFVFSDAEIPLPQRRFYESVESRLHHEGYVLGLCSLEKKGTPYEAIAVVFEEHPWKQNKHGNSIRLVFGKDHPPYLIVKKSQRSVGYEHLFRDFTDHGDPFQELFLPQAKADYYSKADVDYEVRLPLKFEIPQEMWADYRTAVERSGLGYNGLRQRMEARGIQNKSNLLKMWR